jgi:hypothetical protein
MVALSSLTFPVSSETLTFRRRLSSSLQVIKKTQKSPPYSFLMAIYRTSEKTHHIHVMPIIALKEN